MVTPSEQRGVTDATRLRLKAAIKCAWSREAVTRGVAAAKKADYALAHRRAAACAAERGCAGDLCLSWLHTNGCCDLDMLCAVVACSTFAALVSSCRACRSPAGSQVWRRADATSARWTWTRATQTLGWPVARRSPTSSSLGVLLRTSPWHWVRCLPGTLVPCLRPTGRASGLLARRQGSHNDA